MDQMYVHDVGYRTATGRFIEAKVVAPTHAAARETVLARQRGTSRAEVIEYCVQRDAVLVCGQ